MVFSSSRDGNRHLWTARLDGRDARPLTSGVSFDSWPSLSPDGQQIAFVSDRGGKRAIWLINAEGGAPRKLADVAPLGRLSWWSGQPPNRLQRWCRRLAGTLSGFRRRRTHQPHSHGRRRFRAGAKSDARPHGVLEPFDERTAVRQRRVRQRLGTAGASRMPQAPLRVSQAAYSPGRPTGGDSQSCVNRPIRKRPCGLWSRIRRTRTAR